MLAELAAANAAFQILKQTVQNGRDIMSAGKSIASIVDAEEKLRTKGAKKKNSFWFKVGGKDGADLDEFMALQELAQKKKELESMMRLYSPRAHTMHGSSFRCKPEKIEPPQKKGGKRICKRCLRH